MTATDRAPSLFPGSGEGARTTSPRPVEGAGRGGKTRGPSAPSSRTVPPCTAEGPRPAAEIAGGDLIAGAEPHAAALVCAVNDCDGQAVRDVLETLDRRQLYALAVLLAALVPDDRPIRHRLEERDALREAHAAYRRGERSVDVVDGERAYQRIKKRRWHAAQYGRNTSQ